MHSGITRAATAIIAAGHLAIAVPNLRQAGLVFAGSDSHGTLLPSVNNAGPSVSAAITATTIAAKHGGPRVRK
ncbi:Uncharacterised protein [Mycobacteroides abscessus subsp. abscessus]|nr:Uncharacterised protein [Mycobacteroides abscessus subsp. abscessus]SKR37985.1 Uncharacterised protein [Mycobacteroides abscessus subsp. abscessus]